MKYYSGDSQMFRYDNGKARELDGALRVCRIRGLLDPHSSKFKSIENAKQM